MRSVRFSITFGVLALLLALLAAAGSGVEALGLLWASLSATSVSIAYAGAGDAVFAKERSTGRIPWHRKVLLMPYLLLTWASWHVLRLALRQPPFAELESGVFIGRRLHPHEYPKGLRSILDLTHEFDERRPPGQSPAYVCTPILDGAAPSAEQLMQISQRMTTLERPLYLHCAMGHGRTGTVAAALLIRSGLASSADVAMARVAAVREGARPNRAQRAALDEFARALHEGSGAGNPR